MRVLEGNMPLRFVNDETEAHFNRCSGNNGGDFFYALDDFITSLKAASIWSKMDALNLLHSNLADTLLNITGGTDSVMGGASYSFDADDGILTRIAANGDIDMQLTETSATNYTTNDGHFWYYGESSYDGGNATMLLTSPTSQAFCGTLTHVFRIQNSASTSISGGGAGPDGFGGASIVAADERYFLSPVTNGSDLTSRTAAALGTSNIILGDNISKRYKCWGMGGGLTQVQLVQLEGYLGTFMTAIGKAY